MAWRVRAVAAAVASLLVVSLATAVDRTFVHYSAGAPHPADVVLVLGGTGDRPLVARHLLAAGLAPAELRSEGRGQPCPTAEAGVPVSCFTPEPFTTRGEAEAFARFARSHGYTSVLVVAGRAQQWRAGLRMRRCFGGNVEVVGTPVGRNNAAWQVVYEIAASIKAELWERAC